MPNDRFALLFEALPTPALSLTTASGKIERNAEFRRRFADSDEALRAMIAPLAEARAGGGDARSRAPGGGPELRLRTRDGGLETAGAELIALDDGLALLLGPSTGGGSARAPLGAADAPLGGFIAEAPGSVAMFDRDMRYIAASRGWAAYYGLGAQGAPAGASRYELFPETSEEWIALQRRCLAGEFIARDEVLSAGPEGSERRLRWELRPWRDSAGAIGGLVVSFEDVTAAGQAERRNKRLADLLDALGRLYIEGFRESDGADFLRKALRLLRDAGLYTKIWGFVLAENGRLRLAEDSTPEAEGGGPAPGTEFDPPPSCCAAALASAEQVELHDVESLEEGCPLIGPGCGPSILAGAIRYEDRNFGVVVASYSRKMSLGSTEKDLFAKFLAFIGFALYTKSLERERSRAELALSRSERHFRDFFEESAIGLAELDLGGRIRRTNRRLCEFLGYGPGELAGLSFPDLYVGGRGPGLGERLDRLRGGEQDSFNLDAELRRRDGSLMAVNLTLALMARDDPEELHLSVLVTDIGGRREAEALASSRQAQFQAAIESSTDAVLITDGGGRFLEFNQAFSLFHRYATKTDCIRSRQAFVELFELREEGGGEVSPELWPIARALRGEKGGNLVFEVRRRDRPESWLGSYSYAPIRDEKAGIVGTVLVIRDITEYRRTLDTLVDTERRFSRVFNSNPAAIAISRYSDGTFLDVNEAYLKLFGFERREVIGSNAIKLGIWEPEQRKEIILPLKESRHVEGQQFTARTKGGEVRHFLSSIELLDLGGELCVLSTLVDITERLQAEERLGRSLEEREALLRELYHRTKNNMSVIIAMLDLQAAIVGKPDLVEAFLAAEHRIQSMAIVHQKLYEAMDLSHINLGSFILDLLEQLRSSYAPDLDRIEVETELQDVGILIDSAVPCSLILNELLSNAFQHAFPEGRRGRVRVVLGRETDDTIFIGVEDDGVGLPSGLDWKNDGRFGLQTVFNLGSYQLHGEVSLDSEHGVAWRIRFKDNLYAARV